MQEENICTNTLPRSEIFTLSKSGCSIFTVWKLPYKKKVTPQLRKEASTFRFVAYAFVEGRVDSDAFTWVWHAVLRVGIFSLSIFLLITHSLNR